MNLLDWLVGENGSCFNFIWLLDCHRSLLGILLSIL